MLETNKIYNGDCLELMKDIDDKTIDCICTDLPYGVTRAKFDNIIPFNLLWEQYERIIKDNGAIILFGQGMFSAELMVSNKKLWRYNLIWDKVLSSGHLNSNKMPLRRHEDIMIFYKNLPTYNPQKIQGIQKNHTHNKVNKIAINNHNYGEYKYIDNSEELGIMKHPTSILCYKKVHSSIAFHPTQKSIELMINLIKTYTNENDLVLDSCAGSGTTLLACIDINRNFIGIEKEKKYFDIAQKRIEQEINNKKYI